MASAPTSHSSSVWPSAATWRRVGAGVAVGAGLVLDDDRLLERSDSGWLMARAMMSDEPPGG
jgi:hypothetical protein